jgi:hypothetical protein
MTYIRLIAAAATAIGVAFALSPASARSCNDGDACPTVAQAAAPMQLDNFMKTWKPVAVSKHKGKSKSARRRAAPEAAAEAKSKKPAAVESEVAQAKPEPAVTEAAPPAEPANTLAATSEKTVETDGVAVTSFSQPNELDAAADPIQVVAFNDINELDLAAPPPPVPAETVGQSVASEEQMPADNSWIGKLLLAAAGTIAIAGATRFLVA